VTKIAKKLVTADDVRKFAETGQNKLYIGPNTIVTPAAKDVVDDLNICIVEDAGKVQKEKDTPSPFKDKQGSASMDTDLIAKIVREVLASLTCGSVQTEMVKEADPSGLRLVKGNTVTYEKLETGMSGDRVRIKEILTQKESPNISAGFMTIENTDFLWDLKCEEINYIIDGTLDVKVNGATYRGEAGDVFYLPKETSITLSSPDKVKLFYITCPFVNR